jgi:hypothetical protein
MVQTMGNVSVSRDGDGSVVFLDGLVDPVYSLSERGDEMLVVVDLVGVGPAEAESLADALGADARQVAAYDGVVDVVTVSSFEDETGTPTSRVEVQLSVAGRAEVRAEADGLEIRIQPGMGDQALLDEALGDGADASVDSMLEGESDGDAAAMAVAPEPDVNEGSAPWGPESEPLAMSETPDVAILPSAKPATKLTGLSVEPVAGGALVGLAADGTLDNLEVFTLANPARLVIDIHGIEPGPTARNVKVDSPFVTAARVGAHDGKVRIVIDGGSQSGDFADRQLMPGTTGLFVAIGDGDVLAQAMTSALEANEAAYVASAATLASKTAASAPALDKAPEMAGAAIVEGSAQADATAPTKSAAAPASSEVYGLSFERLESMDRTAILASEAITYSTYSPDPATLVVRIPNATISDEAADRLFPEQGGPVSMIQAFQQPDLSTPEVRVVFTRARGRSRSSAPTAPRSSSTSRTWASRPPRRRPSRATLRPTRPCRPRRPRPPACRWSRRRRPASRPSSRTPHRAR